MDQERKSVLLQKNLAAWDGVLFEPQNLDTSLKKNTAFVKKLKISITKDAFSSCLKEINSLSLIKFHTELILATEEALLKSRIADVTAAVETVSALHQRFCPAFTPSLLTWFLDELASPVGDSLTEKEEKDRISKVKVLLRLFTEFIGVGIFRNQDDTNDVPNFVITRGRNEESLLLIVVKEVLSYKIRSGLTLTVASNFVKRFNSLILENPDLFNTLKSFTEAVISRTVALKVKIQELNTRKHKAQIRTRRILDELEAELKELCELFENFKLASENMAPIFQLDLPVLDATEEGNQADNETVIISKESIWQSDEEKRFYQNFIDIPKEIVLDDDTSAKGQEMSDFLAKLEIATSIKELDDIVLQFWYLKLNNKASKNRLLKHFTTSKDVGKGKYYARFLKSNEPYLNDLRDDVLAFLDQGFRSQIYHNGLNIKNIIFFCEMIKFELVPEHIVFHKIRSLIMNLTTPNNIEILSIFFEISGKYLMSEHNKLMEEMLALLELKRRNDKLSINNKMAISNLFLVLKPPSIKTLQKSSKHLKPEQLFLKQLVRNELNLSNADEIRKIVNLVDLNDSDILETLLKLFTKPEKINYENLTALVHVLKNMRAKFKVMVIDTVLEEILEGMESNDYRYNRIRMSQCKYISEIYEQRIIGVTVLYDLVYKILTFGHPNNNPSPNRISEIDPPDDYFRIQMVCTILQSVNFRKQKKIEKLDTMLKYFDYCIFLKDFPLPKDVEFKVVNVFEKYKFSRAESLSEALKKLEEVAKERAMQQEKQHGEQDDDDEIDDEGYEFDEDDEEHENGSESESLSDEEGDVDQDLTTTLKLGSNDDPQADLENDENSEMSKLSYEAYERKLKEEEEKKLEERLEKEFKKLVVDSIQSQKITRSTIDLPQSGALDSGPERKAPTNSTKIPFTLVTKSGKSIATKQLELPKNAKFVTNVYEEEQRRKQEKEKLNRFILQARFDDESLQDDTTLTDNHHDVAPTYI